MSEKLRSCAKMVEREIERIISEKAAPDVIKEAVLYSTKGGGKLIRPCLMLLIYDILGRDPKEILNFACALEMIHTYSLIHDDLPCMDNDDLRRGKPSNHKAFGEANALLAGDSLLTLAFETASDIHPSIDPGRALYALNLLAKSAGMEGMIGGQVLDLAAEGKDKEITLPQLDEIQRGKTVAIIKVAASVAGALAGADTDTTVLFEGVLERLGRAFQIRDDILDVQGEQSRLGKPVGSDSDSQKNTFVTLLGVEKSQQLVDELTADMVSSLTSCNYDCTELITFTKLLQNRDK